MLISNVFAQNSSFITPNLSKSKTQWPWKIRAFSVASKFMGSSAALSFLSSYDCLLPFICLSDGFHLVSICILNGSHDFLELTKMLFYRSLYVYENDSNFCLTRSFVGFSYSVHGFLSFSKTKRFQVRIVLGSSSIHFLFAFSMLTQLRVKSF